MQRNLRCKLKSCLFCEKSEVHSENNHIKRFCYYPLCWLFVYKKKSLLFRCQANVVLLKVWAIRKKRLSTWLFWLNFNQIQDHPVNFHKNCERLWELMIIRRNFFETSMLQSTKLVSCFRLIWNSDRKALNNVRRGCH